MKYLTVFTVLTIKFFSKLGSITWCIPIYSLIAFLKMTTYNIPEVYIAGFENIIKLDGDELQSLSQIIDSLKVGDNPEKIIQPSVEVLKSYSENDIRNMMMSLVSLVDIFESAARDIDDFTTGFSHSYRLSNPQATEKDGMALKHNLTKLLSVYDNIRITAKVRGLILENQRNFKRARVISDVRLVFDENLDQNKKYAVVVHNMKLEYMSDDLSKEFFVTLDLSDLKKIKEVIDRAIEKDRIIRDNQHILNFIDLV